MIRPISLHVPDTIAQAWEALPPEKRDTLTAAIVKAWLEPILLRPLAGASAVPSYEVHEDKRWAIRAQQAEQRGYLGPEQTQQFLRERRDVQ